MPRRPENPAQLEGEALRRWYLRTPSEIEAERMVAERLRHQSYFGGASAESALAPRTEPFNFDRTAASEDDALWMANGQGGYRRIRPGSFDGTGMPDDEIDHPSYLPSHPAAPEVGELHDAGNPHNARLRREWERANGRPWPRTADGRPYDVAHIRALADGGTNTLDNIQPMDPAEHLASHKDDQSRWGKRSSIARTFGGRVEPPAHASRPRGAVVRGLGPLGPIPNITGVLSGRIRTDTPVHFWNDLLGLTSEDDLPPKDLTI